MECIYFMFEQKITFKTLFFCEIGRGIRTAIAPSQEQKSIWSLNDKTKTLVFGDLICVRWGKILFIDWISAYLNRKNSWKWRHVDILVVNLIIYLFKEWGFHQLNTNFWISFLVALSSLKIFFRLFSKSWIKSRIIQYILVFSQVETEQWKVFQIARFISRINKI